MSNSFQYLPKIPLSCYILQNLISSLLFYTSPFPLPPQINPPLILFPSLFISLLHIAISPFCLSLSTIAPIQYIPSPAL
ncbi:DUF418 domain-containing protein, partial [Bacillus pumilus]|uniref:DUF418 domain-containing protein n=1 Tax=Bacillus pumilus TaxID=1408 RepID=UPI003703A9EE